MDNGTLLAEVFALVQQETGEPWCGRYHLRAGRRDLSWILSLWVFISH
jgi:hypothetical protein